MQSYSTLSFRGKVHRVLNAPAGGAQLSFSKLRDYYSFRQAMFQKHLHFKQLNIFFALIDSEHALLLEQRGQ